MALIHERMMILRREIGHISKDRENKFDDYKFRGIDDVYNALAPALDAANVIAIPQVTDLKMDSFETGKGKLQQRAVVHVTYTFMAEDGSQYDVVVVGEGADRGDKAVNKAMTSAFKTCMFQTLCIPTGEKSDSEFPDKEEEENTLEHPASSSKALLDLRELGKARCRDLGRDEGDFVICMVDVLRDNGIKDADASNYPSKIIGVMNLDREPGVKEEWLRKVEDSIGAWPTQAEVPFD